MTSPLKIKKDNLTVVKELSHYDNEVNLLKETITHDNKLITHVKVKFQEAFNSHAAELGIIENGKFHCVKYFEYCDYVDEDDFDSIELVEI